MSQTKLFTKRLSSVEVAKAECKSLGLLREVVQTAGAHIFVPKPIEISSAPDGGAYFTMQRVDAGGKPQPYAFGKELAVLHRYKGNYYGLDFDNTIGAGVQHNAISARWVDFFRTYRLKPQFCLAQDTGLLPAHIANAIENLINQLSERLQEPEYPSFLHGDLWGGNHMYLADGGVALIDPAPYWGDREADIAMTELFGGFSSEFYRGYNDTFPLSAGYKERRNIYNLYHALNHLNIFGTSYLRLVKQCL